MINYFQHFGKPLRPHYVKDVRIDIQDIEDCFLEIIDEYTINSKNKYISFYEVSSDIHGIYKDETLISDSNVIVKRIMNRIGDDSNQYVKSIFVEVRVSPDDKEFDKVYKYYSNGIDRLKDIYGDFYLSIYTHYDGRNSYDAIIESISEYPVERVKPTQPKYPKLNIKYLLSHKEVEMDMVFFGATSTDFSVCVLDEILDYSRFKLSTRLLKEDGGLLSYFMFTRIRLKNTHSVSELKSIAQKIQDHHPDYNVYYFDRRFVDIVDETPIKIS